MIISVLPFVIFSMSRETAGFQGRGDAGRELLTHISTASAQAGAALDQSVASSASGEDINADHYISPLPITASYKAITTASCGQGTA